MGGSGGGGPIRPDRNPEWVRQQLERAEREALDSGFKTELSSLVDGLLARFNDRDRELISSRIDELKEFIGDDLETAITSLFGGSVAKHTYVNGLSDIDTLFVVKPNVLGDGGPKDTLQTFRDLIQNRLGNTAQVTAGDMAVTVSYADGMELQILPALEDNAGKVKIASADGKSWSSITPRRFQEALTRRNQECGGKLVPTIKLAKALNGALPEAMRLSGYHIESLAIDAFRNYNGPKTTTDMLRTLFSKGKSIVLNPIRDSTGQSVHVDDYLGPAHSRERKIRSGVFERLEKRMINATAARSLRAWKDIFGLVDD